MNSYNFFKVHLQIIKIRMKHFGFLMKKISIYIAHLLKKFQGMNNCKDLISFGDLKKFKFRDVLMKC